MYLFEKNTKFLDKNIYIYMMQHTNVNMYIFDIYMSNHTG